jgi:hypothetical protein
MGLTLQFVIGDKETIIEATKNFDFDYFNKLESENQLADFSIHLIPDDLNLLVNAATELQSIQSFGLRENLNTEVSYFDSEDCGAYLVDTKVRTLFATLEDKDVLSLTQKWFDKMNELHDEDLRLTDDAIHSVKQLISICKNAEQTKIDMVHVWFL